MATALCLFRALVTFVLPVFFHRSLETCERTASWKSIGALRFFDCCMNRIHSRAGVGPASIMLSAEDRERAHFKRLGIHSLLIRCVRSVRLRRDSNEWPKADSKLAVSQSVWRVYPLGGVTGGISSHEISLLLVTANVLAKPTDGRHIHEAILWRNG